MYEFYRQTIIGRALQDTIEDLISEERITCDQAQLILKTFDKSIPIVFARTVTSTLHFRGAVESYNYVDGVWNFVMRDFHFTTNNKMVKGDFVKIVACDGSGNDLGRKRRTKKNAGNK